MEAFSKFDNKIVTLANPLPDVKLGKVYERAGIRMRNSKNANQDVFALDLRWGAGEDQENASLLPGKSIRIPERIAKEVYADFKPVGDFCATNPGLAMYRDENERNSAMIEALEVAENHYHAAGALQLESARTSRNHSDQQVEQYKASTYSTYFLAMAKEKLIRERREELQKKSTPPKG